MYKSIKAHIYSPARRTNTRNQNEIRSSFHRLTMRQKAVSYTGPHSWNRLPEALRQMKTIGTLKKRNLKSTLLVNMSNHVKASVSSCCHICNYICNS